MLSLNQVRLLENKVEQAVERIRVLNEEKQALESQLTANNTRIAELERVISAFKEDQGRIEEGILSALSRLSDFEDAVLSTAEQPVSESPLPVAESHQPAQESVATEQKPEEDATSPSFDFDPDTTSEEQELSFDDTAVQDSSAVDIPEIF